MEALVEVHDEDELQRAARARRAAHRRQPPRPAHPRGRSRGLPGAPARALPAGSCAVAEAGIGTAADAAGARAAGADACSWATRSCAIPALLASSSRGRPMTRQSRSAGSPAPDDARGRGQAGRTSIGLDPLGAQPALGRSRRRAAGARGASRPASRPWASSWTRTPEMIDELVAESASTASSSTATSRRPCVGARRRARCAAIRDGDARDVPAGVPVVFDRAFGERAGDAGRTAPHWAAARGSAPSGRCCSRARLDAGQRGRGRAAARRSAWTGPRGRVGARNQGPRAAAALRRGGEGGRDEHDRSADRIPPDERGRFGAFGGRFVPETVMAALDELEAAVGEALADPASRPSSAGWPATTSAARRRCTGRAAVGADVGGAPHLAQARGPRPHGRAQDQQRRRPGAARARASASGASSPRPAPASTAWPPPRCARASAWRAWSTWARRTSAASARTSCGWACWAPRCGR